MFRVKLEDMRRRIMCFPGRQQRAQGPFFTAFTAGVSLSGFVYAFGFEWGKKEGRRSPLWSAQPQMITDIHRNQTFHSTRLATISL